MHKVPPPPPAKPEKTPGRLRRALVRLGVSIALLPVFGAATAAGIALHLNTKAARYTVQNLSNQILEATFQGRVTVGEIHSLSLLRGLSIQHIDVIDQNGNEVLALEGIQTQANAISIAYDWIKDRSRVRAILPFVRADEVKARILVEADGKTSLEKAFALKKPPKKKEPAAPSPKPTLVFLNVSRFELGRAHLEGAVPSGQPFDGEISRVAGSLSIAPDQLAVDIDQSGFAEKKLLPQGINGSGNFHVRAGKALKAWGDFAAHLGEIEMLGRALFDDGRVESALTFPKVTPEALQRFSPDIQMAVPLSAEIRADGLLPDLQVALKAKTNTNNGYESSIELEGDLRVQEQRLALSAALSASDINPRFFGKDFPEGRLSARASAQMVLGKAFLLMVSGNSDPGVLDGQDMPAIDMHAAVLDDFVSARFWVHEPGAELAGGVELFPGERVRFFVGGNIPSLANAKRFSSPVSGSARFTARGTYEKGILDSNVQAILSNLSAPSDDVEVGRAEVRARIVGNVEEPGWQALRINTSVNASNLTAGGQAFDQATVLVDGPLGQPLLTAKLSSGDQRKIEVSGVVDSAQKEARNVQVTLRHKKSTFEGKIGRVAPQDKGILFDGFSVHGDGIGGVEGTLAVQGKELVGKLRGTDIEAGKLFELAGLPKQMEGLIDLDLDLKKDGKGRSGHVHFALEDGEAASLSGISSMMSISFNESKMSANGYVRLVAKPDDREAVGERCDGTIAQVRVYGGEGELSGGLLDAETWKKLSGSVQVNADDWDLRCLVKRLDPAGLLPLSELSGKVGTRFVVERPPGQKMPSIRDFILKSRDLVAAGPEAGDGGKPVWETRGVDVALSGALDGVSGKTDVAVELLDPKTLVKLNTTVMLDLGMLLDKPRARLASLRASPMMLSAQIPERTLRAFSELAAVQGRMPDMEGSLRVDAFANGTMGEPHVALRAMAKDVAKPLKPSKTPLDIDIWHIPLGLDTLVTYDGKQATLDAHVLRGDRERLTVNASFDAALDRLLNAGESKESGPAWKGNAKVTLHPMRLEELPVLAASGISGVAQANASLLSLNDHPRAHLEVDVPEFRIAREGLKHNAHIVANIRPNTMTAAAEGEAGRLIRAPDIASAEISLSSEQGGKLTLSGFAGASWKERVIPVPETDSAADVLLSAKAFRLNALQPLLAPHLSMVDGFLDGNLRVGWLRASDESKGQIEADLSLMDGAFYVPVLGQQFRDAHVRLISNKSGVVRFDDIGAKGLSGEVRGWAYARFDGFTFKDAAGEFEAAEGRELPLAMEGVPLGRIRGKVEVAVKNEEKRIFSSVRVPSFHLELPTTIGRNVQSLSRHPDIKTLQPLEPRKDTESSFKAPKIVVQLNVEQGEVEGQNVHLVLSTPKDNPPRVELTDTFRLYGDIELVSGKFELLSKSFELDRGFVHLRGEEDPNPFVNITLHWDAPDGSRIFVDYVGTMMPITDDKIRFRSDPPRGKQEIVGILVLGSEYEQGTVAGGGSSSSDTPFDVYGRSTRTAASSLIAGLILDELGGLLARSGFSTSIVTTESGALKTGIVYQRGTTTTQVSYESGSVDVADPVRSLGSDTRRSGRTELSIDWRFHRNWLLRGSVGVGGDTPSSGIDLLWQYRY